MDGITISERKDLPYADIKALRESVGWAPRSEEKWRVALERSTHVVSAWHGDQLVGMGRRVDDGVMAMFYDLAVHRDFQAKGISQAIGRVLIEATKDMGFSQIGLFAAADARLMAGYERAGFVRSTTAMELAKYQTVPVGQVPWPEASR